MADQKWKVGDVVQLKSGGPRMTVREVDEEYDIVGCTWFDEKNKQQSGDFSSALLTSGSFTGLA